MRKQPYNISRISQKIEGTVSQMLKSPNNLISALFSALWEDVSSVTWTWDFPLIIVTALPLEEPSVKTKIAPFKGWIENFFRKITECVFKKCKSRLWNKRTNETKFDPWNLSGQLANDHYLVKDLQLILIEWNYYICYFFSKKFHTSFFLLLYLIVQPSWDKIKLFFLGSLVDGTNGPFCHKHPVGVCFVARII